jgi:ADP-ribose pyrophosphatase YjhB (NUDIX family)
MLLHTLIHPKICSLEGKVLERPAARAIVLQQEDILLLYTQRYNDYSLPGGGLNDGEDVSVGKLRELQEETGAQNIQILRYYGYIDEYRPSPKPEYDLMYMRSHFYLCNTDRVLGSATLKLYEKKNGMTTKWINIHHAIAHNERVISEQHVRMGASIQRETLMLKQIALELI